jgi:hypothetical protein
MYSSNHIGYSHPGMAPDDGRQKCVGDKLNSIMTLTDGKTSCDLSRMDTNYDWPLKVEWVVSRAATISVCAFLMIFTSSLITTSYDPQTAPISASLPLALMFYAMLVLFPDYTFIPSLVLTDCVFPIISRADFNGALVLDRLGRAALETGSLLFGGSIAALVVWRGMVPDGTDAGARFLAHVRSDISDDSTGGIQVFGYTFLANAMFAIVYYGHRLQSKKSTKHTCLTVQARLTPEKAAGLAFAFFLLTAAMTPMFGNSTLDLLASLAPAIVTGTQPAFYVAFVAAQYSAAIFVAGLAYWYHKTVRACADCKPQ